MKREKIINKGRSHPFVTMVSLMFNCEGGHK